MPTLSNGLSTTVQMHELAMKFRCHLNPGRQQQFRPMAGGLL